MAGLTTLPRRAPVRLVARGALRQAHAERERRLRPLVAGLVAAVRAAVTPERLLALAARGQHQVSALDLRLQGVLLPYARPLEEALLAPERPVRKADPWWGSVPPEVLAVLVREQVGALVRDLTARQLATVQQVLAALAQRGPDPSLVNLLGSTVGLTPQQSLAVQRAYDAAQEQGALPAVAARTASAVRRRLESYRATLITRTETTRYLAAVVQRRGEEYGTRATKAWVSARDGKVDVDDPEDGPCVTNDNGDWIAMREVFADGSLHPPAHPGCRCLLEIRVEDL